MGIEGDRIKFNVGGRIFETTSTTLANAGRESFFGAILDQSWNIVSGDQVHFIDRNPECFAVLLDLLRTGDLTTTLPDRLLYREASFYGLLPHVRAAKWGPFDPNRLRPSSSVSGHAPGDPTALRASPDGGCAVAHGSMVHVYDWTMAHHPPITLAHRRVNDVGWASPSTLVVSVCERIGSHLGSIALFSPSAASSPRHVLHVLHSNSIKSFTAGALAFGADSCSVYSSCRGRSNEYGIGLWDLNTGALTDFFYEPPGWSLGEADKLQWVNDKNCLMVATLFPRKDDCYISLLDFREKRMVWHWSDIGAPRTADEKRVRDAVAMEEGNSVCVVNEYEELGFIDMRVSGGSVRWCSKSRLMKGKVFDEPCYPKLAVHEGQLFCSMNDCISVFCGPDCVLTSRLRRSYGGSICDFSIGGDRLFALHSEENVFDIWETPPPPIL